MDYYCMYQKTENELIIFGVGTTEDEAEQDAIRYTDPEIGTSGLHLAKCTPRVYDYVDEHGGVADEGFRFVLDNGIMKTEDC